MTDCATRYTRDFVLSALLPGARRVLEIGCGGGALAAALKKDGLDVVAIDADAEMVAEAAARGVDARVAVWPDFADGQFDAVLFTNSLHHIADLEASVAAAFAAIGGSGRVIVEDHATEGASPRSEAWFRSFAAMLRSANLLDGLTAHLAEILDQAGGDPHDHDLHDSTSIRSALEAQAGALRSENAAYYFRYLLRALEPESALAPAILDHERTLIAQGLIDPLGRRHVAAPSESS